MNQIVDICQIFKPIGMNIVTKGTLFFTKVIMKATYLNNVNYGYIKIECSFIRINMATYKSINAFMKYDMDLVEKSFMEDKYILSTKTDPTAICDPNFGSFNTFSCTLSLTIPIGSCTKEVYNSHFCVA